MTEAPTPRPDEERLNPDFHSFHGRMLLASSKNDLIPEIIDPSKPITPDFFVNLDVGRRNYDPIIQPISKTERIEAWREIDYDDAMNAWKQDVVGMYEGELSDEEKQVFHHFFGPSIQPDELEHEDVQNFYDDLVGKHDSRINEFIRFAATNPDLDKAAINKLAIKAFGRKSGTAITLTYELETALINNVDEVNAIFQASGNPDLGRINQTVASPDSEEKTLLTDIFYNYMTAQRRRQPVQPTQPIPTPDNAGAPTNETAYSSWEEEVKAYDDSIEALENGNTSVFDPFTGREFIPHSPEAGIEYLEEKRDEIIEQHAENSADPEPIELTSLSQKVIRNDNEIFTPIVIEAKDGSKVYKLKSDHDGTILILNEDELNSGGWKLIEEDEPDHPKLEDGWRLKAKDAYSFFDVRIKTEEGEEIIELVSENGNVTKTLKKAEFDSTYPDSYELMDTTYEALSPDQKIMIRMSGGDKDDLVEIDQRPGAAILHEEINEGAVPVFVNGYSKGQQTDKPYVRVYGGNSAFETTNIEFTDNGFGELLKIENSSSTQETSSYTIDAESSSIEYNYRGEDAQFADAENMAIGVFDGLGGRAAGEVASGIARNSFITVIANLPENPTQEDIEDALRHGFEDSVRKIEEAQASDSRKRGTATTATVGKIYESDGKLQLTYLQRGDSRLYAVDGNGKLTQISTDHNRLNSDTETGKITPEEAERIRTVLDSEMSIDIFNGLDTETKEYIAKNLYMTKSLSAKSTDPDIFTVELNPDTQFVFAVTDGIHDNLTAQKIESVFSLNPTAVSATHQLFNESVAKAFLTERDHRSKDDDMAVATLKTKITKKGPSTESPDPAETAKDKDPEEKIIDLTEIKKPVSEAIEEGLPKTNEAKELVSFRMSPRQFIDSFVGNMLGSNITIISGTGEISVAKDGRSFTVKGAESTSGAKYDLRLSNNGNQIVLSKAGYTSSDGTEDLKNEQPHEIVRKGMVTRAFNVVAESAGSKLKRKKTNVDEGTIILGYK